MTNLEPSRHAILGPSAATRWLNCTPSARFEQQQPDDESIYAAEGTLAHAIAALVLDARAGSKIKHADFLAAMDSIERDVDQFYKENTDLSGSFQEMYEYAEIWAGYICELGGDILVEKEYNLDQFAPEGTPLSLIPLGFGTSDAVNLTKKVIYSSDLKYGQNVPVSATDNPQLKLYAVGALSEALKRGYKPETVVITIYQPRAGGWSTWSIPVKDLLAWAKDEVAPKAALAIAGQGEFKVGDWCKFCKARAVCGAYYKEYKRLYELFEETDPREMTPDQVAEVLEFGGLLSSWFKKVTEVAIKNLSTGKDVPGFKLVNGRGKRVFKNEDDVVDVLLGEGFESEDIFNTELKTLTDIEKTLGKKRFTEVLGPEIINKPGSETIAPLKDPRPPVGASAADEYD